MSYLDEQHSRATITANALPRYRRVLRASWVQRLITLAVRLARRRLTVRLHRGEAVLPVDQEATS